METEIERRRGLSGDEFLDRYARPGRPVVLEGAAAHWDAVRNWSVDWLAERWPAVEVEVSRHRGPQEETRATTLGEYVRYLRDGASEDEVPWYLANWRFEGPCPELMDDFETPLWFRDNWLAEVAQEVRPRLLWMFVGPARAGSWLHLDVAHTSAWNVQVTGRKRWLLFAPEHHDAMYDGQVDAFSPDLERFPKFPQASALTADVGPSDVVFTPSLWWHQTRNLEEGIAVTANYADSTNCDVVSRWLDENPACLASFGVSGLAAAFRDVVRQKRC